MIRLLPVRLTLAMVIAFGWWTTEWAGAHLIRYPDYPALNHLENRERSQVRNLGHAKYVCRRGGGQHKRWACRARGWIGRELAETRAALAHGLAPIPAIHSVFGAYGHQAVRVAHCETGGTFDLHARNGQYLGLFQMGSWERATYGHGFTALEQSRAAHRYFVASGRDWSPWECQP